MSKKDNNSSWARFGATTLGGLFGGATGAGLGLLATPLLGPAAPFAAAATGAVGAYLGSKGAGLTFDVTSSAMDIVTKPLEFMWNHPLFAMAVIGITAFAVDQLCFGGVGTAMVASHLPTLTDGFQFSDVAKTAALGGAGVLAAKDTLSVIRGVSDWFTGSSGEEPVLLEELAPS